MRDRLIARRAHLTADAAGRLHDHALRRGTRRNITGGLARAYSTGSGDQCPGPERKRGTFMARSYRHLRHHRRPVRLASWGLGVFVAAALSSLAVLAQDNRFTVFLAVTDAAGGKPVLDLKPEDIAFSEGGMPGKVATLERYNLPVQVT